jgi:hypothetical protein
MRFRAYLLVAALAAFALPRSANAICTAAQIIASESACQTNLCFINNPWTIENGCTLDFGVRDVTILSTITIGNGTVTFRAGKLTVGGKIDGVGSAANAHGGMAIIQTTTDFVVGQLGSVDVSAAGSPGQIMVTAGGAVSIAGKLLANFLSAGAPGGLIVVDAANSLSTTSQSLLSARGGIDSEGGGEIDLSAGQAMTLQTDPDVGGYDGGVVSLAAGGKITIAGIAASGTGDAGSGGCIDLLAGTGAEIKGDVVANGHTGTFMTGGCGGLLCLDGGLGDLSVNNGALVAADGASPDGGGGQVGLTARGSIIIRSGVSARGPTGETCGGDTCIEAGYDVTTTGNGVIDVSGGDSGGELEILAARDMTINGNINASGVSPGSLAGDVTMQAGLLGRGSLTVAASVDARSNAQCSDENGCGLGGFIDALGCNVTISPSGALLSSGPDAGVNTVIASELMTLRGTLNSARTVPTGAFGVNRFVHRIGQPPIQQGTISPAPVIVPVTVCPTTGATDPPCLTPCPVCGDGKVDFPETCDKGAMPPQSCSGCSIYCQTETCDDGRICTGDSCNPSFGCVYKPTPGCHEPTATATTTPPTPTVTRTANASATASATRTPTASSVDLHRRRRRRARPPASTSTPTASLTATRTLAATATATVPATSTITATAVATSSATSTASAIVTATPAATDTATATATATATESSTPEPTLTAGPSCAGDCDGSGKVGVNELVLGVNIALGRSLIDACRAFDRNNSNTITINELVTAVNAALDGC